MCVCDLCSSASSRRRAPSTCVVTVATVSKSPGRRSRWWVSPCHAVVRVVARLVHSGLWDTRQRPSKLSLSCVLGPGLTAHALHDISAQSCTKGEEFQSAQQVTPANPITIECLYMPQGEHGAGSFSPARVRRAPALACIQWPASSSSCFLTHTSKTLLY